MKPADYITPVSGLQYYVTMIDYGKGRARPKPTGFGADVNPEYSRRQVIEDVRETICAGLKIAHVKFIDGNDMQDVTEEILTAAIAIKAADDAENDRLDREFECGRAASFDHARDLRKHEVA